MRTKTEVVAEDDKAGSTYVDQDSDNFNMTGIKGNSKYYVAPGVIAVWPSRIGGRVAPAGHKHNRFVENNQPCHRY